MRVIEGLSRGRGAGVAGPGYPARKSLERWAGRRNARLPKSLRSPMTTTDSVTFAGVNSPMGDFLRPEGFIGPRGLRALGREGSVALEIARYLQSTRADRRTRRG